MSPDAPTGTELAVRGAVYVAVLMLVGALRTGRTVVRWALVVLLGGVGTLSLLVEPVRWLAAGGQPWVYMASAAPEQLAVVALRAIHPGAVITALVLMFRPRAQRFFHRT